MKGACLEPAQWVAACVLGRVEPCSPATRMQLLRNSVSELFQGVMQDNLFRFQRFFFLFELICIWFEFFSVGGSLAVFSVIQYLKCWVFKKRVIKTLLYKCSFREYSSILYSLMRCTLICFSSSWPVSQGPAKCTLALIVRKNRRRWKTEEKYRVKKGQRFV